MTTPKKPLTKNESAIQLGNVLKYASRGGSTKAGILSKIKKLLIKPKPTKNSAMSLTPLKSSDISLLDASTVPSLSIFPKYAVNCLCSLGSMFPAATSSTKEDITSS